MVARGAFVQFLLVKPDGAIPEFIRSEHCDPCIGEIKTWLLQSAVFADCGAATGAEYGSMLGSVQLALQGQ